MIVVLVIVIVFVKKKLGPKIFLTPKKFWVQKNVAQSFKALVTVGFDNWKYKGANKYKNSIQIYNGEKIGVHVQLCDTRLALQWMISQNMLVMVKIF